jgi:hypothetical protein
LAAAVKPASALVQDTEPGHPECGELPRRQPRRVLRIADIDFRIEAIREGDGIQRILVEPSSVGLRAGNIVWWASAHHDSGARLGWAEAHPTAATATTTL